jgi:hypothetical protein
MTITSDVIEVESCGQVDTRERVPADHKTSEPLNRMHEQEVVGSIEGRTRRGGAEPGANDAIA